jgi:hypothetical protein
MKNNYMKTMVSTGVLTIFSFSGLHAQHPTLECVSANVTHGKYLVLDEVPNYFTFAYDYWGDNNHIDDGGNDMYDGANYLNTNLEQEIFYTNGVVTASAAFGSGGSYVTTQLPGLFMMAADMNGVNSFYITGNNGADGGGQMSTYDFLITYDGQDYLVFTKRVFDAWDPSINHMMIIPYTAGVTHNFSTNTNDDFDELTGLSGVDRLYYLLFAKAEGEFVTNLEMESVAQTFMELINGSSLYIESGLSAMYCPGDAVSVAYSFCDFTPAAGNVFSLQLSDEFGDFSSPTVLGTVASTTSGIISGTLSSDLVASNGYKVRVIASNPQIEGFMSKSFSVRFAPASYSEEYCIGDEVVLYEEGNPTLVWYESSSSTTPLLIADEYVINELTENVTLYVSYASQSLVQFSGLDVADIAVVDHDSYSGDDRGGIAITPDFLYVVGDNFTVRMNAEDLSGMVSLPIRDGIISDLSNGDLFDLYNTNDEVGIEAWNFPYTINALARMDMNLEYTGEFITLSTPITIEESYDNGLFAGSGFVILYDYYADAYYHINLSTGLVSDAGNGYSPNLYGSENWADWGFATIHDGDTLLHFRDGWSDDIVGMNLNTGEMTVVHSFDDISDMCSITYSPWHSRLYFHHESSSELTDYNYLPEVAGYIGGSHVGEYVANNNACRSLITITAEDCSAGLTDKELTAVKLYPNPATEQVQVDLTELTGNYAIQVTDLSGRVVYEKKNVSGEVTIPVYSLQSGYYVVNVVNDTERHALPFIKK